MLPSTVIPEIEFVVPDAGYIVNETFSVTIECTATGIPAPEIRWFTDTLELTGVDTVMNTSQNINERAILGEPEVTMVAIGSGDVYQTDRMLTLYNAMNTDTNDYRCEASNVNIVQPSVSQNFTIFVQSKFFLRCKLLTSSILLSLTPSFLLLPPFTSCLQSQLMLFHWSMTEQLSVTSQMKLFFCSELNVRTPRLKRPI